MDGWMDDWMDRRMNGCITKPMNRRIDDLNR